MTGKAYWAIFQYYDGKLNKMAFKKRPVLVIGKADDKDWVVLPISRVTRREYLDSHYDFEMNVLSYPKMSLKQTSYVRTHKQTVLNEGEFPKQYCRENQIWWGLEEAEKLPFIRSQIRADYESLTGFILNLGSSGFLSASDSILAIKKALALDELICDGRLPKNSWHSARQYWELARQYASLGERESMYENLTLAARAAKAFESRPETQCYTSLLLGTVTEKAHDYETDDSWPLPEILRDKWLSSPAFDAYRKEAEFQHFLDSITK